MAAPGENNICSSFALDRFMLWSDAHIFATFLVRPARHLHSISAGKGALKMAELDASLHTSIVSVRLWILTHYPGTAKFIDGRGFYWLLRSCGCTQPMMSKTDKQKKELQVCIHINLCVENFSLASHFVETKDFLYTAQNVCTCIYPFSLFTNSTATAFCTRLAQTWLVIYMAAVNTSDINRRWCMASLQ